jgi:hypothetical protein
MKKLLDAAHPAVAESGRHPKKIKTMQELWNTCPKLKDASLFMADLVKKNPKVKKTEILREWAEQRGNHPETSGAHMESESLFAHSYLSMKMLREYVNKGNRAASSNSADANATAAAAAENHVACGGGTLAEAEGRGGVSSGGGGAASDAANANAAAAPAAAANVSAAAGACTATGACGTLRNTSDFDGPSAIGGGAYEVSADAASFSSEEGAGDRPAAPESNPAKEPESPDPGSEHAAEDTEMSAASGAGDDRNTCKPPQAPFYAKIISSGTEPDPDPTSVFDHILNTVIDALHDLLSAHKLTRPSKWGDLSAKHLEVV